MPDSISPDLPAPQPLCSEEKRFCTRCPDGGPHDQHTNDPPGGFQSPVAKASLPNPPSLHRIHQSAAQYYCPTPRQRGLSLPNDAIRGFMLKEWHLPVLLWSWPWGRDHPLRKVDAPLEETHTMLLAFFSIVFFWNYSSISYSNVYQRDRKQQVIYKASLLAMKCPPTSQLIFFTHTFTFTFRAFGRRFHPKRLTIKDG